jgi:uncharacterized membrane protein YfbV (UPF0208 family)|tara:strand:- start:785 stop:1123 length:339 start_codon:yes stop_codon:yes gene_type:complete
MDDPTVITYAAVIIAGLATAIGAVATAFAWLGKRTITNLEDQLKHCQEENAARRADKADLLQQLKEEVDDHTTTEDSLVTAIILLTEIRAGHELPAELDQRVRDYTRQHSRT